MKRAFLIFLLLAAGTAAARTIVLEGTALDRVAMINEDAPRLSWAAQLIRPGVFDTANLLINPRSSLLLRFDLSAIPKGQRVTRAELVVPIGQGSGADLRFYLWRLSAEWGPGVSWQYRSTVPKTNEWAKAGARGAGTDRAIQPSVVTSVIRWGESTLNVTEDVALWKAGAAPAWGWLFTVEDTDAALMMGSPIWQGLTQWKLKVTYEPE